MCHNSNTIPRTATIEHYGGPIGSIDVHMLTAGEDEPARPDFKTVNISVYRVLFAKRAPHMGIPTSFHDSLINWTGLFYLSLHILRQDPFTTDGDRRFRIFYVGGIETVKKAMERFYGF
jgi:hypothetical protein